MSARQLSLADHVCLAIIAEGPTHGWSIVRLLRSDGDLGRIWSLSRPLTYRSIATLIELGLVDGTPHGRRVVLTATSAGERTAERWLAEPVDHLRSLRTEFLLKVRLHERRGRPFQPLAERQLAALADTIAGLTEQTTDDPVEWWRRESAAAAERFLRRLAGATNSLPA